MNTLFPEISVIMPAYNAEKYIAESIESVLNQTFSNFELIILYLFDEPSWIDVFKVFLKSNDFSIVNYNFDHIKARVW